MEIEQVLKFASDLLVQRALRPLSDVETLLLRGALNRQTYGAIAESSGYSVSYLCKNVGPVLWRDLSLALGEPVGKNNVRAMLERLREQSEQQQSMSPPVAQALPPEEVGTKADWGGAIDVSVFFGRSSEQEKISQWIVSDRCRFILLLGMGGIGKTALSIKVAQQVQADFEFVIWRSLRNAPLALDLLVDLIKFLAQEQDVEIPDSAEAAGFMLLHYLRQHRCLLILDNAETLLQAGDRSGHYQPGYEEYGRLFQQIGETAHQSCLMVTSREPPFDVVPKMGVKLPLRSLIIKGLPHIEGQALISSTGQFTGDLVAWQIIIERYAGNPLALKIAAAFIRDLCNGDLYQFLEVLGRSTFIFDDIRDLLDQQFQRLSPNETAIMFWLAIKRQPVTIQVLAEALLQPIPPLELLRVMFALQGRALVEKIEVENPEIGKTENCFTQQPVVMEYVTRVLIDRVNEQICNWQVGGAILCEPTKPNANLDFLRQYALLQALAPDYVQEMQSRLILQPLLEKLKTHWGSDAAIQQQLMQITQAFKGQPAQIAGYSTGNIINLLRHLQVDFQGCDFSNQTIWQANLLDLPLHDVNFAQADLSKSRFSQNFGWIQTVAFSPDDNYLAGGDNSGMIHLWNCKTEQHQLVLQGHQSHVYAIAFSPNRHYLASGSFDGAVKLWDIRNGQCLSTIQGHSNITTWVTFSKDGDWLASCSVDGTIKLWNAETGQCIKTFTVNPLPIRGLVFTQDQQYLISGCADHLIRVWNVATGECVNAFVGHTAAIRSIDLSPDGQYIVSGGDDNTVKIWEIQSGQCVQTFEGHKQLVFSVAFSPNGKMVASAGADQTVRLWNLAGGQCLACFREHKSIVFGVAFSHDGHTLVSGSMDRMVKLWDVAKRRCSRTFSGHKNVIWSVAVVPQLMKGTHQPGSSAHIADPASQLPSSSLVATGSFDGKIRLWNILNGQCITTMPHLSEVLALAISPDGTTLISGNSSHQSSIKVWDLQSQSCLKTIPAHTNMAKTLCFSHNGLLFASGGGDKIVQLFHSQDHQVGHKLVGHQDTILAVAFSGDDALIASSSLDQTARIWDVETGECLHVLTGYRNPVLSVRFHPHESILATGGIDSLKLWLLQDQQWQLILTIQEGYSVVTAIAFSSDGKLMATGSFDRTVRIWDFASKKCLRVIQTGCCLYSLVFSTDDQFLISSGDNGSVQIWQVETGESFRVIKLPNLYAGMNLAGVKGMTEAQQAMLVNLGATRP